MLGDFQYLFHRSLFICSVSPRRCNVFVICKILFTFFFLIEIKIWTFFTFLLTGEKFKKPDMMIQFSDSVRNWKTSPIGHVRYINILARLRGFRVKIANFSSFFCPSIPKRDLDRKKTTPNIEFWPESLGAMLEYWYIERGLLTGPYVRLAPESQKRPRD